MSAELKRIENIIDQAICDLNAALEGEIAKIDSMQFGPQDQSVKVDHAKLS